MRGLKKWISDVFRMWKDEFHNCITDGGVILFFIVLPLAYPIVYTAIYNPEVVRDINVVVVDNCRSADSRQFTRMAGATENIHIIGYASSMDDAREAMAQKECYAILEIPEDFSRRIGRNEQAFVQFYSDATLLIRYRGLLMSLSDVSMAMGAEIRQQKIDAAGELVSGLGMTGMPTENKAVFLGNPQQGFASFAIQAILVFILQQSLILGVCMLAGGRRERRAKYGYDPRYVNASPSAAVVGRTLTHTIFYLPTLIYILYCVPYFFSLPQNGSLIHYLTFMIPMIIASSLLGQVLQAFVKERETSLLVIVFMSVVFLFLSGITWPRFAMPWYWRGLGDLIPGVWGVEGFVHMNANGADLSQVMKPYRMMWILALVYFVVAVILQRRERRVQRAGESEIQHEETTENTVTE